MERSTNIKNRETCVQDFYFEKQNLETVDKHREEKGKKVFALAFETASGEGGERGKLTYYTRGSL